MYRSDFVQVLETTFIDGIEWSPADALLAGITYRWQIVALRGDETVTASPYGEAKFRVLDAEVAAALRTAAEALGSQRLDLGILYADKRLLDEAERGLRAAEAGRDSAVARKLLNHLQAIRRSQ